MLKNFRVKRSTLKKSNFQTFGFFLLFSALVWVLVQLSKEYTQIIEIPLEYVNAPLDKSISSERPVAVEARVQDRGFSILYYQWFNPALKLDLERAREEGSKLIYSINENREDIAEQLDLDLERTRFLVDEILIDFQPRKKKRVKVVPEISLSYAVGFSAGKEVQISPDSIEVSGPQSIIDTIEKVSTVKLKINNISSDLEGRVAIDTTHLGMLNFYQTRVNYSQEVEKFTEGNARVEVEVLNVPPDINLAIFPREVLVHYQVNLQNYEMVKATDFSVVVDYEDIQEGDDFLIAEIAGKPEFVTNVRLSERKIQFVIKR